MFLKTIYIFPKYEPEDYINLKLENISESRTL